MRIDTLTLLLIIVSYVVIIILGLYWESIQMFISYVWEVLPDVIRGRY